MRTFLLLLLAAPVFAAAPASDIKVDQVGYLNSAPKLALVSSKAATTDFTVRTAKNGGVVFRGRLAAVVDDPDSGDRVQTADFTRLTRTGQYYLEVRESAEVGNFPSIPESIRVPGIWPCGRITDNAAGPRSTWARNFRDTNMTRAG